MRVYLFAEGSAPSRPKPRDETKGETKANTKNTTAAASPAVCPGIPFRGRKGRLLGACIDELLFKHKIKSIFR
jgi:hypothetical protein